MSPYTIGRAEERDLAKVYEYETAYILELEPENIEAWRAAEERTRIRLRDSLEKMLILFSEGEIAGHAYWDLYEGLPHVFSIYISPGHRRRCQAGRLLLELEELIKEAGYDRAFLSTLTINPAQHLFDRSGYRRTGIENGWIHFEKVLE